MGRQGLWRNRSNGLERHRSVLVFWLLYKAGGASLGAQAVKNLTAVWETRVRSLGREDPLEEEMTTHSSILACRIPWTEEPGGPQPMGLPRVLDVTE